MYSAQDLRMLTAARRAFNGGDHIPLVTMQGEMGHANVHEDRVELFLPALFALAPTVGKMLAPVASKVISAGKEFISGTVTNAANAGISALTGPPAEEEQGEEEESGEEEDSYDEGEFQFAGQDIYGPFDGEPQPGDPVGVYVQNDRVTLFIPALLGAAAPLLGGLGKLFGKKKKKPAVAATPGPQEGESVAKAVESALAGAERNREMDRLRDQLDDMKQRESEWKEERRDLKAQIARLKDKLSVEAA